MRFDSKYDIDDLVLMAKSTADLTVYRIIGVGYSKTVGCHYRLTSNSNAAIFIDYVPEDEILKTNLGD